LKIRNEPNARYERMTTEPVSRLIVSLAVPTIISMVVTALYNMADTYFVGKIGTSATGAVGIVFSIMAIIQVIGMTFGVGSGSYVARLLGQRKPEVAARVVSSAFFLAILCGSAITVAGEIFLDPLLRLLGSTDTILPFARDYAGWILLGAPIMAASFVMNVNLRSEGSAVLALMGIGSGAVINIALDPLFIFTFGFGIKGAAIATVLSQLISFLILLSHYVNRRSALRISPGQVSLEGGLYLEILRSGMPTFLRQFLVSFSAIVLNNAASSYGDAAIAGMSVVTRLMMFMASFMIGFGQGFQPVAAFNYGAGLRRRVYDAFWFTVKVGTGVFVVFSLASGVFAPMVIRAFRNDPEVVRVGAFALRMQCITLPFTVFIVISNMMFQYIGKPARASILALSRQGLLFVPIITILSRTLGLTGIQVSQAVADGLTFVLSVLLTAGTLKAFKSGDDAFRKSRYA